jgi:protein-tyrosine kinase
MSKVYEALKKAQREGLWHDETNQTGAQVGPADIRSGDGGSAADTERGTSWPGEPEENAKLVSPEKQLTGPVGSRDSTIERTQGSFDNVGSAEQIFTDQDPLFFGTEPLGRRNRWWRFWQGEPVSQVTGPRLIIHQESLSRAAEQFQVLRANLESWVLEHNQRIILITSALPGEGKSFVALNLAVALSHAGSNVLLIDADLRAPSLHIPFNLVPLGGLLPYLEGKQEFAESITPTPERRLKLLAAAGVTLLGSEALAGPRMRALIECARQLEPPHIVLLDSPAAAVGTEVQLLSKLVDGALLVVSANMTPRAAVTRALELIKGAPMVTAVLNRFEPTYSDSRNQHHYTKSRPGAEA